ncbi:MAG: hypothetical protein HY257_04025 [Chloroflexi bacterium]|nr:hypothetical protein [Chloroflexota bacterium]
MEVNNLIIAFLILLLLGWAVLTEFRYRRLARSFRALMMGRAGADLETVLVDHVARRFSNACKRWKPNSRFKFNTLASCALIRSPIKAAIKVLSSQFWTITPMAW